MCSGDSCLLYEYNLMKVIKKTSSCGQKQILEIQSIQIIREAI